MHDKVSFLSLFIKGSIRHTDQSSILSNTPDKLWSTRATVLHTTSFSSGCDRGWARRHTLANIPKLQSSRRDATAALANVFVARQALKTLQDESVLPAFLLPAGMCIYPGTPMSSGSLQSLRTWIWVRLRVGELRRRPITMKGEVGDLSGL